LIYVATTAQWIQQIIKCGLYRAFLSYKVSDVLLLMYWEDDMK